MMDYTITSSKKKGKSRQVFYPANNSITVKELENAQQRINKLISSKPCLHVQTGEPKAQMKIGLACCHTDKTLIMFINYGFFDFSHMEDKVALARALHPHMTDKPRHVLHLMSFKIKDKCRNCTAEMAVQLKQEHTILAKAQGLTLLAIGW